MFLSIKAKKYRFYPEDLVGCFPKIMISVLGANKVFGSVGSDLNKRFFNARACGSK